MMTEQWPSWYVTISIQGSRHLGGFKVIRQNIKTLIMSLNFVQEMDSLCQAFEKLSIRERTDNFTCFPKLPKELQPIVPKILSGINGLSHDKAKKVPYRSISSANHVSKEITTVVSKRRAAERRLKYRCKYLSPLRRSNKYNDSWL